MIKTQNSHISKFEPILWKWHKWNRLKYSWLNLFHILANSNLFSRNDTIEVDWIIHDLISFSHIVYFASLKLVVGNCIAVEATMFLSNAKVMQNLFNLLFLLLLFTSNMRSNTMIPKHCNTQQKIALFQKSNDHIQCVKKLMILVSLNERI